MEIPFDIKDKFWDNVHPGMMRRIKHRLILVRHGESESNIELTTTGKTSEFAIDHALTDVGKEQAEDVAVFLEEKGLKYIDRIEISPLDRAVQTAMPCLLKKSKDDILYKDKDIDIILNYELREKYTKSSYWCKFPNFNEKTPFIKEINFDDEHRCLQNIEDKLWLRCPDYDYDYYSFEKRANNLMDVWKTIGTLENRKQTLVFSHSQLISQLLSSDKSFHLANGSISIIDIDEKNYLHVQVANYTKHLRNPTGMHTCIF